MRPVEPPFDCNRATEARDTVQVIPGDSRVELSRFAYATLDAMAPDPLHDLGLAS
jgi:hypothetical protein